MPYVFWECRDCDRVMSDPREHGPEDEYCEGESGYERIELYAMDSPGDRKAWHMKQAAIADAELRA